MSVVKIDMDFSPNERFGRVQLDFIGSAANARKFMEKITKFLETETQGTVVASLAEMGEALMELVESTEVVTKKDVTPFEKNCRGPRVGEVKK